MVALESFTSEQRELLVSLPYRVGLWVSESDKTGGNESDAAEMQALETIVTGFAEDFLKSEFIQRMMEETIRMKGEWKNWQGDLDAVPDECRRALNLLVERLDPKEVTSFKITLMDIATFVALAYCEADDSAGAQARLSMSLRMMVRKLRAMITKSDMQNFEQALNISVSEQRALDMLGRALGVGLPDMRDEDSAKAVKG